VIHNIMLEHFSKDKPNLISTMLRILDKKTFELEFYIDEIIVIEERKVEPIKSKAEIIEEWSKINPNLEDLILKLNLK